MKKRARLLKEKATSSLLLSIEQFNKPFDTGRVEAVLILLDHSLEMLWVWLLCVLNSCGDTEQAFFRNDPWV